VRLIENQIYNSKLNISQTYKNSKYLYLTINRKDSYYKKT